VAFRPDGKVAAVAARSSVFLVDTATGYELMRLPGQEGPCSLAFSPDGKALVSGGWDKAVRLWETATGKEVFRVEGLGFVNAVAFAPDGRRVAAATGWADGVIHVFEVPTGKELLRLRGHGSYVGALAFAPDGKTLASGQRDTTVLVWDLASATAKLPARDLGAGDVDRLWADLAAADARTGQVAVWALAAAPAQAVPFLKEHVSPAVPADPKHIDRLIADLDGEQFAVRDAAARELRALGAEAEPALRRALKGAPSAEARKQIEALLAGPPVGAVPPPEVLRRLRAVQVLEQVGSPEARSVLEGLGRGAPAAVQTREAAAALERLARRADAPR
jgi:hypothetical protein